MQFKRVVFVILFVQGVVLSSFAQNRDVEDRIFNEPAKAGWTQIFLGFTELSVAALVSSNLDPQRKIIKEAELGLQMAKDLPLNEAQRQNLIDAIVSNAEKYDGVGGNGDIVSSSIKKRLERIQAADLVTAAEKKAAIKAAEVNLAETRASALKAAQNLGILDKSLRVLRVGAAVLLVGDVVGRVYVWNAMDANPTLSPMATYFQHLINR